MGNWIGDVKKIKGLTDEFLLNKLKWEIVALEITYFSIIRYEHKRLSQHPQNKQTHFFPTRHPHSKTEEEVVLDNAAPSHER